MRSKLFLLLLIAVGFSCEREEVCAKPNPKVDQDQLAIDVALIDDYINTNVLSATGTSSGIRYTIHEEGNSRRPDNCSLIRVYYEGRLLDNRRFDYTTPGFPADLTLNQLVKGWQMTMPLIGEGGRITIFLPSGFAYGESSRNARDGVVIESNSPLIFDIELIQVF